MDINIIFRIKAPYFKSNINCAATVISNTKIKIKGGYSSKLSAKSPFNSAIKERCIPQPGHSKPRYCL